MNYPTRIATEQPCLVCGGTTYTWSRAEHSVANFVPLDQMQFKGFVVTKTKWLYLRRCEECRNVMLFDEAAR